MGLAVGFLSAVWLCQKPWRPLMKEPYAEGDGGDEAPPEPSYMVGVECPRCAGERVGPPNAVGVAWCRVCQMAVVLIPYKAA